MAIIKRRKGEVVPEIAVEEEQTQSLSWRDGSEPG